MKAINSDSMFVLIASNFWKTFPNIMISMPSQLQQKITLNLSLNI